MDFLKFSFFLLSIFAWNFGAINGYKILGLFPLNIKSHFLMFESVMKGLAKRGHQVVVVSHFPLEESLNNYTDLSLKGSTHSWTNSLPYQEFHKFLQYTWLKNILVIDANNFCDLLGHPVIQNLIKKIPENGPYDFLVTEVSKKLIM